MENVGSQGPFSHEVFTGMQLLLGDYWEASASDVRIPNVIDVRFSL